MRLSIATIAVATAFASLHGIGEAFAGDTYDKDTTEMVLRRAARSVHDNCGAAKDESGKAVGPWGKTVVTIRLGRNGHSKGASVPTPFDGSPTGKCAVQAFTNLTFPPWNGPDTNVDWEVEIVSPDAAHKGRGSHP